MRLFSQCKSSRFGSSKSNPIVYQTGSKVDFGHLWTEGVGYARHRNRQKEVIDAHPTNYDDTGPSPLRATVFQTRLPTCSTVANRFDPCPRQEHRSLRP